VDWAAGVLTLVNLHHVGKQSDKRHMAFAWDSVALKVLGAEDRLDATRFQTAQHDPLFLLGRVDEITAI